EPGALSPGRGLRFSHPPAPRGDFTLPHALPGKTGDACRAFFPTSRVAESVFACLDDGGQRRARPSTFGFDLVCIERSPGIIQDRGLIEGRLRVHPLATVHVEKQDDVSVARLRGEIDTSNVSEIGDALSAASGHGSQGMVIDLSEVAYLNSASVKLLFDLAE